ncbi:hypothetical protein E2562_012748 [Oryza meyeriana var. granulata]|uniref:Uncharacterized protein n=1 Tax=Oryza meyeriana var. granulata TaxID=110450 RepID=A0A6G1DIB0_9ORYZ|nr:hypothetical protein E2562_012748 [Oryza meyeriana var. granulata]
MSSKDAFSGLDLEQQYRLEVTVHNEDHTHTSSMRIKTTTTSQAWVADKATDILKILPNMGAKELQKKLQDDHKRYHGDTFGNMHPAARAYREAVFQKHMTPIINGAHEV